MFYHEEIKYKGDSQETGKEGGSGREGGREGVSGPG